ncbi:MAG TPA: redoxin domain-containing protein [Chloroflexota bacterium]|nr:redoxin domain-containing protein [Chloroflexota bacterium]
MQLVELQKIAGELASRDVAPFAISYDSVETLGAFAERNAIGYPLLADEGSNAIRGLGMLDEDLDQHHAEMGGACGTTSAASATQGCSSWTSAALSSSGGSSGTTASGNRASACWNKR